MAHNGSLPPIHRYITDHDAQCKAVISAAQPEVAPTVPIGDQEDTAFTLAYTTTNFPIDLNNSADLDSYARDLSSPIGLASSNGSVLRFVDMGPGLVSPMHRTVSVDYGVVLEGEVELRLDSGQKRLLKRGDVAIQRATNHAWCNTSETEWARMMFVLLPAKPVEVGGKVLGEELGTIKGVPPST